MFESPIRVLLRGNGDITSTLLPAESKSGPLADGLAEVVRERFGDAVSIEIAHEPGSPISTWRRELEEDTGGLMSSFRPHIVVLSIEPEVASMSPPESEAVSRFEEDAKAVVSRLKSQFEAHVFWYGMSTVNREKVVSDYGAVPDEPPTLRIQRLDLALIRLSHQEGISIIDVDRVVAEIGASNALTSDGLTERAATAVRDEVVRVMEDYGFFDDRPLLAQVGQQGSSL